MATRDELRAWLTQRRDAGLRACRMHVMLSRCRSEEDCPC